MARKIIILKIKIILQVSMKVTQAKKVKTTQKYHLKQRKLEKPNFRLLTKKKNG